LNEHSVKDVHQTEMHTVKSLVPEWNSLDVEIAIEKLKRCKLSGIDQILAELTQAGGNVLSSEIHRLINSVWNKEEALQQWKESAIIPVCKKGDKTDNSNYRWISLLPTTYKILSDIIWRLTLYIGQIIGDHQCEFWCNRSTTDQIFCICQILEKKWKCNGTEHELYVNFKKAYDSVRRESTVQYSLWIWYAYEAR